MTEAHIYRLFLDEVEAYARQQGLPGFVPLVRNARTVLNEDIQALKGPRSSMAIPGE